MAWSTRQLADLAGTTVQAVRHYHRLGLLEEPHRTPNSYKQYGPAHLIRLLQIKRVSELGVPLRQIDAMRLATETGDEVIRDLDAELADTIERLHRIRADLAALLEHSAPLDTPPVFTPVVGGLNERDRALIAVYSRVLDEDRLGDLRELIAEGSAGRVDDEFEALTEDADESAINQVAESLAVELRRHADRFPWMTDASGASPHGREFALNVIVPVISELYTSAQLSALARAHALAQPDGKDAAAQVPEAP